MENARVVLSQYYRSFLQLQQAERVSLSASCLFHVSFYLSKFKVAFTALKLLPGRQEEHRVSVWLSVWSEVLIVCTWSS